MNRRVLISISFVIILYALVVNINLPKEYTFNGFEHNKEEILDRFEIRVKFKTGLRWNLKQEYKIVTVSYLGNTYDVIDGFHVDLRDENQPTQNLIYMHDSTNYKFNILGFRGLNNNYIAGYRFKDGIHSSNGLVID